MHFQWSLVLMLAHLPFVAASGTGLIIATVFMVFAVPVVYKIASIVAKKVRAAKKKLAVFEEEGSSDDD